MTPERVLALLRRLPLWLRLPLWRLARRVLRSEAVLLRVAVKGWPVGLRRVGRSALGRRIEGGAAFRSRDYVRAAAAYRDVVAGNTSDTAAWLGLARAQRALGLRDDAAASAQQALDLAPDSDVVSGFAAQLAAERGDLETLRRLLGLQGAIERLSTPRLRRAGALALRAGDLELAVKASALLLQREPDDEQALVTLARASVGLDDHRPEHDLLERAKTSSSLRLLSAAARVHVHRGEAAAGLALVDRMPSDDARLLAAIGPVVYDQGHLDQAAEVFARAAAADPLDIGVEAWRERIREELLVLRGGWRGPGAGVLVRAGRTPGRVLHVVGRSLPQVQVGYTIRTDALVKSQKDAGLDPQVVTSLGFPFTDGVPSGETEERHGVVHHRLPDVGRVPSGLAERLDRTHDRLLPLVTRLRPALMQPASDYMNALAALAVRESTGTPVVYEVRGFWEESWLSRRDAVTSEDSDQYRLRRQIETHCMREADHIVTLAEAMRTDILGRGIPPEKVTVIPNAVDATAFVPVDRDEALAASIGLEPTDVVVGYISSLVPYEGIEHLIRAVALLQERSSRVRVLIVGDGPERGALELEAARCLRPGTAIFTGKVPHQQVLGFYGLIDVFVVPRRNDRVCQLVTPLKPYEAMASGRAVVVSSVPALLEMIEPGVSGLSFEADSPESLAGVLDDLLADDERRRELGRTAREWVVENRTWVRNAERYRSLYAQLGAL